MNTLTGILLTTLVIILAIIGYAALKYTILCQSKCTNLFGYWKVPFRAVYCESFFDFVKSCFECHIWLKIHRTKIPGLPGAALLACFFLMITGCADTHQALPYIRLASAGGTAFAVKELKISPTEQQNIYGIATAINSISGGNVTPTVEQLKTAIASYVTTPGAEAVGSLVTSLYAQYYPKLTGNAKDATDVLQAISGGVMDALQGNSAKLAARKNLPLNVRIAIWQTVRRK